MLRRLELVGFKSFADKTTFTFGDGITAIVGPNGSGKSNIVDAVRWILGEQSAKSLRGGEMADVIFNGSASRRSFGMAEVTMTFDNSRRLLATESEEVQITRRVFRSGEGEYLINQQVCRLKDIKELFLGSGAGADAYCIIEQGKVDVLLQASTKDRRTIFEEAAGISRFKAKKVETLRKLERVDQNLQRLQDIVDEVEKQTRSVKLQAAKAERYQEYTNRLRELRLGLGLDEYGQLTQKLQSETAVLDNLKADLEQRSQRAADHERQTQTLDELLAGLEDGLREQEAQLAASRQNIASQEATIAHQDSMSAELTGEMGRTRSRLTELSVRVGALCESLQRARLELAEADDKAQSQRSAVHELEQGLNEILQRLTALQAQVDADKAEHFQQLREAAHWHNETVARRAHADNLQREQQRLHIKTEQTAEILASVDVELEELQAADRAMQARLLAARQALNDQRHERNRTRQMQDNSAEEISHLRQERSGLASRIDVLNGLIKSHEGLGAGVREVFALLERPEPGSWATVLGIIGDFLTVRREFAPLIDLALGDWAQRLVVRDLDSVMEALASHPEPFPGRVSFLPIRCSANEAEHHAGLAGHGPHPGTILRLAGGAHAVQVATMAAPAQTTGVEALIDHPGVIAPAEKLVSCDRPELADLPARLLGRTLIVRDLTAARTLAALAPGYRFITLAGELLESDGTLTVGKHHAATGILSRKSELQERQEHLAGLDRRLQESEANLQELREQLHGLDVRAAEEQESIDVLAEQAADLRRRLERHGDRRQGLHEEVTVSRGEIDRVDHELASVEAAWREMQQQGTAAEARVQFLHDRLHQADTEIRDLEKQRDALQQELTLSHVALAKVEERLASLSAQHQQLDVDWRERRQEQAQCEENLAKSKSRLEESIRLMLQASATLAHAYLAKESGERLIAGLVHERDRARQDRTACAAQAQAVRSEWQVQSEHIHTRELEASQVHHRRQALVDRIREDYQVDLGELYLAREKAGSAEEPMADCRLQIADLQTADNPPSAIRNLQSALDPAATEEEIAELRRKLTRLGSVNLDSLQELSELESRGAALRAQFDDLTAAKRSLEEIIAKINQDSRRLFLESFATIRTHFQELFRKLFGGGMADVVIEDENDILESGIEIIARPPGKDLRSISLMSGGEKTLTAVALLLAIFRSKPSPFCILDEVDAALDEANIDRFTAVLREFLDRSQFIIVTHSKKTMAAADVLYGITMQESGISKQVSVRFDDWPQEESPPSNGAAKPQLHIAGGTEDGEGTTTEKTSLAEPPSSP